MAMTFQEQVHLLLQLAKHAKYAAETIRKCFPIRERPWRRQKQAEASQSLLFEVDSQLDLVEQLLNPTRLVFEDDRRGNAFHILQAERAPVFLATAVELVAMCHNQILTHYGWQGLCSKEPKDAAAKPEPWQWPNVPEIDPEALAALDHAADDLRGGVERWKLHVLATTTSARNQPTKPQATPQPVQEVAAASDPVDDDVVHPHDVAPPQGYFGPLEGNRRELTRAIIPNQAGEPDPRQLFTLEKLRMKGVWIRGKGQALQAWFQTEDRFRKAAAEMDGIIDKKNLDKLAKKARREAKAKPIAEGP